ncbi:transmembrane protein 223-like isoform X1 [Daphnia carinata]|uniref:transmembrane protein 223-like isoform X1 n=1 Tax=Daphnia carinata TaxID=120202 RepID=UPI00257ACF9D|nr:transmembrane protein 223-like isoform X1 [Daphnia carinata]
MAALMKLSSFFRPWPLLLSRHVNRLKDNSTVTKVVNHTKFSTKPAWEMDTNVAKDVVLYAHHNPQFHKYLNIFALTQLGFWFYLAEFSLSTLKDVPVPKQDSNSNLPWYRSINLGEEKYRRGITGVCLALGVLILGGSWMFSLKSIKNIVLRKGGKDITIITYAPFNKIRYVETPLRNVSATQSRSRAPVSLPVKVKGYMGYFVIDMKGEFKNPTLFDATVGLKRILSK